MVHLLWPQAIANLAAMRRDQCNRRNSLTIIFPDETHHEFSRGAAAAPVNLGSTRGCFPAAAFDGETIVIARALSFLLVLVVFVPAAAAALDIVVWRPSQLFLS